MKTLDTVENLVNILGDFLYATDLITELQNCGYTLSDSLLSQLEHAAVRKRLSATEQQHWAEIASQLGPVSFHIGEGIYVVTPLPAGDYDFTVALRLEVASEALAGLYATRVWPRSLATDIAGALFPLEKLRDFADGIPEGDDIIVGPLSFTAPPTLVAVDGTDKLILNQAFSLSIERVLTTTFGTSFTTPVTSLTGVLHPTVQLTPSVGERRMTILLDGVTAEPGTSDAIRIDVDADSPLQPRDASALATLIAEVQDKWNFAVLLRLIQQNWSISPEIKLPVGDGVPIRVQRVDVRSVATEGVGALVVGILLGATAEPDPGSGNPARLTNPFNVQVANLYARAHEDLLRKIAQQAHSSGELNRRARQMNDDLRVDGVNVDFMPNAIRFILDGRVVNACGVGPVDWVDVNFRATMTYRFSVFGGQITVTEERDVNLSNYDIVACVALGVLEALIAGAAFGLIGFVVDVILQIINLIGLTGTSSPTGPTVLSGVFDPRVPVPGTELLPRVEALQGLVSEDALQSFGSVSLRPDNINTYVYAAFLRRQRLLPYMTQPVVNAQVELLDQDVPAPSADDVVIPAESDRVIFSSNKLLVKESVNYDPPISDQVLARGTTDDQGQLRFVLTPTQIRTTGGTVTTTLTTVYRDQPERDPDIQEEINILTELYPDLYFRVRLPEGNVVDTRSMANGLMVNLGNKRVGSPDSPLTFNLSRKGTILGWLVQSLPTIERRILVGLSKRRLARKDI